MLNNNEHDVLRPTFNKKSLGTKWKLSHEVAKDSCILFQTQLKGIFSYSEATKQNLDIPDTNCHVNASTVVPLV